MISVFAFAPIGGGIERFSWQGDFFLFFFFSVPITRGAVCVKGFRSSKFDQNPSNRNDGSRAKDRSLWQPVTELIAVTRGPVPVPACRAARLEKRDETTETTLETQSDSRGYV